MGKPDDNSAEVSAEAVAAASEPILESTAPELALSGPPIPVAEPAPNLRKTALRGAMWMGLGYGGIKILNFANGMFLSYYVEPRITGVIGMVGALLMGLHMFSDVGIGMSVIQNKRGDEPDFLNTAWTLQVLRGLGLWAATWVFAWPLSLIWDEPKLAILIPVIGATAAIDGLNATALIRLQRNLARGRLMALEMTVQVTGMLLTLAWVICIAADEWAFVIGMLATSGLNMTLTHLALPGPRSRFRWERSAVQELLHFGKWIFLSTVITYFAFQAEPLVTSWFLGMVVFGVLTRATTLAAIATELMSKFASDLVFPVYSRMHHEGRDIRTSFKKVHLAVASFAALLVSGLLASGSSLCLLYGNAYHDAAWMLPFVAAGAWFKMLESTTGISLLTLGQARSVMLSNASRVVGVALCVPLGYWLGSQMDHGNSLEPTRGAIIGLLVGFLAADFIRYLVVVALAHRHGMTAIHYDLTLSAVIAVVAALGWYLGDLWGERLGASFANPKVRTLVVFLCQGSLVVVIWGGLYLAWFRGRFRRPRAT